MEFWLIVVLLIAVHLCTRKKGHEFDPINGARWASEGNIRHLFKPEGMLVAFWGKYLARPLYYSPFAKGVSPHRMCIGGTGRGKTSQKTILAALTWKHSAIFMDLGGELADKIGRARKQFGFAVKYDPFGVSKNKHVKTVRLSPMARIVVGSKDFWNDVTKLAKCCIHQGLNDSQQRYWYKGATDLIAAIIAALMIMHEKKDQNLAKVYEILCGDIYSFARDICSRTKDPNLRNAWVSYAAPKAELNKALEDILLNARGEMEWLKNPVIADSLSHDDFRIEDLKHKVGTLFIVGKLNDVDAIATTIRAVVSFCLDVAFQHIGRNTPILFTIEEYYALQSQGKLEDIDIILAAGRHVQLFLMLLIQNWSELVAVLGPVLPNHYLNSCGCIEFLSVQQDLPGAHVLSELCGESDVVTTSFSEQVDDAGRATGKGTVSTGLMGRKLALPHELMNMADDQQIVLIGSVKAPICCYRKFWWDTQFKHQVDSKH